MYRLPACTLLALKYYGRGTGCFNKILSGGMYCATKLIWMVQGSFLLVIIHTTSHVFGGNGTVVSKKSRGTHFWEARFEGACSPKGLLERWPNAAYFNYRIITLSNCVYLPYIFYVNIEEF